MISFDELPTTQMGKSGEKYIISTLKNAGYHFFKCTDAIDSDARSEWEKAPKLHGPTNSYVFPDLQVFKNREINLVEIKTKTKPTYYRKREKNQHGIDLRHYNSYLKVKDITGLPVWLIVYEKSSQDILSAEISSLSVDHHGTMWQGCRQVQMVYFNRDDFTPFDPISAFHNNNALISSENSSERWFATKSTIQQTLNGAVTA